MKCVGKEIFFWIIILSGFSFSAFAQLQAPLEKLSDDLLKSHKLEVANVNKYLRNQDSSGLAKRLNSFLITSITKSGFPVFRAPLNADAAITTGVNKLQNQSLGVNLKGKNMLVGIWDDGMVKDHIELGSRILTKEGTTPQTHATHVTGTILASGINPQAKGMAPEATATTWYFDNDDTEMAALAKPDQSSLLFSNHSYGTVTGWTKVSGVWVWTGDPVISTKEDFRHGFYGVKAQTLDQIAYLAPYYSIVWAAGNDRTEVGDGSHPPDCNGGTGYDCIIPDAVAKNVITVGAVYKVATYTNSGSVVMSNFSSWGPTDDGRIKPDVVGAGVSLFSLSAAGTNLYATASGTSMATPNVTGSLVLLQELYSKLHGGNFMKASTLKALAIHTTKETGSFDGPDYQYGWGLLDVAAAAKVLIQEDDDNTIIHEGQLMNGSVYAFDINSQANQKITVTLCWTDPAGTPVNDALDPVTSMLVNDLDVRITDQAGHIQFPWILNPSTPSTQATTGDNFRDNVEKIEFNYPAGKAYTVQISHKGKLINNSQDFSVVVTCSSSTTLGKNYYWISNGGQWNDGSHWSLSTGGPSANTSPTQNDNIIFDENSFDGLAAYSITLQNNQMCKRLKWLTDKPAVFALEGHLLTITETLSVSGKNMKIGSSGVIEFNGTSDHYFNIQGGDFTNAAIEFNGGNNFVYGPLAADRISIKNGALKLQKNSYKIHNIEAEPNTSLDITGITVDSLMNSFMDESVNLKSTAAVLRTAPLITLNWNNVDYNGTLEVSNGSSVLINGPCHINQLLAFGGSSIELKGGTTVTTNDLQLNSTKENPIAIKALSKADINFLTHAKYCNDNLVIENVDAIGNAVIAVGLNSTVTNASNWITQDCGTILFPDFQFQFPCQNAVTFFTDSSTGAIESWFWNFGDPASADNESGIQNSFHRFTKGGTYLITLTITNGKEQYTYSKSIQIEDNTQAENTIVANGNSLVSFKTADNYQWFKDNQPIENATLRSYDYKGEPGSFVVAAITGECNDASSPFLVTAVDEFLEGIKIYPNPAHDVLRIRSTAAFKIIMYNVLSQSVLERTADQNELNLDIRNMKAGVYFLELHTDNSLIRRKIIIN